MYKFLTKNGQTISFLVGLLITVVFLALVFGGLENFNALDEETARNSNLFNFGINASVALIIVCAVAMIAFIILNVVMNIKGNLRLLIGLAVVLGLFFIMFGGATFEAEGTLLGDLLKKNSISSGQNGFIVGGIWTAVILTVLAFVSFIVLEILNFFK